MGFQDNKRLSPQRDHIMREYMMKDAEISKLSKEIERYQQSGHEDSMVAEMTQIRDQLVRYSKHITIILKSHPVDLSFVYICLVLL